MKTPEIKYLKPFSFPDYELSELDNGCPIYQIVTHKSDLVNLDFCFYAGRAFEDRRLASNLCAGMLNEGTKKYTGNDFAELVDYYGASFSSNAGMDICRVSLFSPIKYLDKVLPAVLDAISAPIFPEKEFSSLVERNKQRLKVELKKNDVLAYRLMTERVFGGDHPYGYNSTEEIFEIVQVEDLKKHHEKNYLGRPAAILSSCVLPEYALKSINEVIGQFQYLGAQKPLSKRNISLGGIEVVDGPGKNQAALQMGCRLFGRGHDDYTPVGILTTILGGYFGSRLMKNIREKQGFTYGIYANVESWLLDGYMGIGAKVNPGNVERVIEEIGVEMKRLRENPVSDDELKLLRNYITGSLMNLVDGPLKAVNMLRSLVLQHQDVSFFKQYQDQIQDINSDHIKALANNYLLPENFFTIVVR